MKGVLKYNYDDLYREFLESRQVEVFKFLIEKKILKKGQNIGHLSGGVKDHFLGWSARKKHDVQLAQVEARQEVRKGNMGEWKKTINKAESAEMNAINTISDSIEKGWPIYAAKTVQDKFSGKEVVVLNLDKNDKKKIIGYRPLNHAELGKALEQMRLIQGKAGNIELALPTEEAGDNPMQERLAALRKNKKDAEIKQLSNKKTNSTTAKTKKTPTKKKKSSSKKK